MRKLLHMSLLILSLAASILCVLGFVVSRSIDRDFEELDRQDIVAVAHRVGVTFGETSAVLSSKLGDWGAWDEAYHYVTRKSDNFPAANITDTVIGAVKISVIAYLDQDLNILTVKRFNPESGVLEEPDRKDLSFLSKTSAVITGSATGEFSGLVRYGDHIALVGARPITKGDGSGPALGRVVFLRKIDDVLLAKISNQTEAAVKVSDTNVNQDFSQHPVKVPDKEFEIYLQPQNAVGFLPLLAANGDRLGFLRFDVKRKVRIFADAALKKYAFIYGVVSILILLGAAAYLRLVVAKKHVSQLVQSESRMRTLVESIPGYVSWFDLSLRYISVNEQLARDYGLLPQDFVGRKLGFQDTDPNTKFSQHMQDFINSGASTGQFEVEQFQSKAQKTFLVSLGKPEASSFIVAVGIDITELKRLEAKSASDRQILLNSLRLKQIGEMAGSVSHDISNPLSIVYGATRKLANCMEAAGHLEVYSKEVTMIENSVKRISHTVQLLRDFSKADEAAVSCTVQSVLQDSVSLSNMHIEKRRIKLDVAEICGEVYVFVRPSQVKQALLSVIEHCIEGMNQEERWIKISTTSSDQKVQITVVYSGPAISEMVRQRLMEPLVTTTEFGKDSGLGLSMAKDIIEAHQGTLTFVMQGGRSSFVITLPESQVGLMAS